MKTVQPKDHELNRYEEFIYDTISQHDGIWVQKLQKIVCDSTNARGMGRPTFLKYLKSLENNGHIHYLKLKNKNIYYLYDPKYDMRYEEIESFSEEEFNEISDIVSSNLLGIEFLIRTPKNQVDVLYNSLLQIFGYQMLIKILRGVEHPEGEENNAINELVQKLQDLEDSVYMRTSTFMAEPILSRFGKIIDYSYLRLVQLGLWKWKQIEKFAKRGDEQAITIKNLYREEFDEDSRELIKRLKVKMKVLSEVNK